MIIDLRYHVVSIVAVFLALGLGIIIGVNFGKTVNLEFEGQIQRLEETYQKIREDQRSLQTSLANKDAELEIAEQFQRAILPNLIVNRLLGKRIAIIRTNTSVDFKYTKDTVNILKQAGAEVTSVTTFNKPVDWVNAELKTEILDAFDLTMAEPKMLSNEFAQKVAQIILKGDGEAQLVFLQNKELVQLWGDYNRGMVDTIVFFGGGLNPESGFDKTIDLPLLDAFRKYNAILVGVEPSFATQSYMRLYQSKCQGTVDNIETPPGEATLVYLLSSGNKGHYGVKDSARALIPVFKINY